MKKQTREKVLVAWVNFNDGTNPMEFPLKTGGRFIHQEKWLILTNEANTKLIAGIRQSAIRSYGFSWRIK